MGVSGRRGLPVVVPLVQIPLLFVVVGWLGRGLAGVVAAVFRRPLALTILAGLVAVPLLVVSDSAQPLLTVLLGVVGTGLVWRWLHRSSFDRCVGWPLRSAWRSRRVYQRYWSPAMVTAGLAHGHQGNRTVPRLVSVRSTGSVDRVTLALLAGQVPADFAAVADRLAQTFGVLECRVRRDPRWRNRVVLWMLATDPLTTVVPPFEPEDPPNLNGLPVAVGEDGLVYRLRLLGTHLLLVGATGAGKGSVLWSLIRALGPGVANGHVALWVVDPKGGMELAPGRGLFARFCHGTDHDTDTASVAHEIAYAELLEEAVAVMRQRQDRLRGVARLHQPTSAEPLIVVVVDELASLTSYVTDRDAKKRIGAALSLLLSQGRAVGVSVVAALQDPRKEVLPARDLFPTRVALRLTDDTQVDMVLGDGARKRGACADLIPDSLPGVGYLAVDGVAEPVRVRFSYLTDTDITDTVDRYAPASSAQTEAETVDTTLGKGAA